MQKLNGKGALAKAQRQLALPPDPGIRWRGHIWLLMPTQWAPLHLLWKALQERAVIYVLSLLLEPVWALILSGAMELPAF